MQETDCDGDILKNNLNYRMRNKSFEVVMMKVTVMVAMGVAVKMIMKVMVMKITGVAVTIAVWPFFLDFE